MELFVAEEFSPIQSPDPPPFCESSGLREFRSPNKSRPDWRHWGQSAMKASSPVLALRTMNHSEFAHFRERATADYARARVKAGDWDEASAGARARAVFDERLPRGLSTPEIFLWTIVDADTGRTVGSLWIERRLRGGKRSAHIVDLFVEEDSRGTGIGRGAMQLAEAKLRDEWIEEITLNVFGDNDVALSLYRTLGFKVIDFGMLKRLDADQSES